MKKRGTNRYKKGFAILLLFFVVLCTIGLVLPSYFKIEKTIEINASTDEIFPYINSLHKWKQWTVINPTTDVTMDVEYHGSKTGVGSIMIYEGDRVGQGEIQIYDNEDNSKVDFTLLMNKRIESTGHIYLKPIGLEKSEVTIVLEGDVGFHLANRYIILTLDQLVGRLFKESLSRLKTVTEKNNTPNK
jgi:uncharacterized protein YndB with AHSA1/START domain